METNRKKASLVSVLLLSLMLGSLLAPIGPVHAYNFAITASIACWLPGPDGVLHNSDDVPVGSQIPPLSPASTFYCEIRVQDAEHMDAWDSTLSYYTLLLTATYAAYTTCGGYQILRQPSLIDHVEDKPPFIRGQVGLGESYAFVPTPDFSGSCVLATVDFVVDATAQPGMDTMIHLTRFQASSIFAAGNVIDHQPVVMADAKYGSGSVRYVDLLASPIRKRCIIENHHYRWSLSRDGGDGNLSFDCTLVSIGNAYPVVGRVAVTIIDQTINAVFPTIYSNECLFTAQGQSCTVIIDKGTTQDSNNDGIIDLQLNHSYLTNAEAQYDCLGTTIDNCAGQNDRVFSFTVKA